MTDMNMNETENRRELNLEEMDQVSGGVWRTVNTGTDLNAVVRFGPSKSTKQIASLPNGTTVDTVTDKLVYDPVAERHFVEVVFTDRNGNQRIGWIASSILGMRR